MPVATQQQKTPLSYLMHELGLTAADWKDLSESDKATLKAWAAAEIEATK